jgi:hypothetical protein
MPAFSGGSARWSGSARWLGGISLAAPVGWSAARSSLVTGAGDRERGSGAALAAAWLAEASVAAALEAWAGSAFCALSVAGSSALIALAASADGPGPWRGSAGLRGARPLPLGAARLLAAGDFAALAGARVSVGLAIGPELLE